MRLVIVHVHRQTNARVWLRFRVVIHARVMGDDAVQAGGLLHVHRGLLFCYFVILLFCQDFRQLARCSRVRFATLATPEAVEAQLV